MPEYIQVFGKTDVLIAYPITTAIQKLGEAQDMIDTQETSYWHNVPGDRHGGPQGPPIEVQWLGETVVINMVLSRWDPDLKDRLSRHNVHNPPTGTIDLCRTGALMLRDRSWRLCLRSLTCDEAGTPAYAGRNYPCCILRTPIDFGQGTKYSALSVQWEAHRAPEGHPAEGILFDNNIDDIWQPPAP